MIATTVGYAQGKLEDPSYELVCTGATGHTEVPAVVLRDLGLCRNGIGHVYTMKVLSL